MSGPEHYRAAERLLATDPRHQGPLTVGMAQVHATLALAAATVAAREVGPLGDFGAEWHLVAVQDSGWIEATS
jgi:hypothetical protein